MKARNEQKKRCRKETAARTGALLLSFFMLAARPAVARADYSPAGEDAQESLAAPEYEPQSDAVVAETEGQPFSVAGNGTVIDDAADDGTKEFFTVRTKNSQTFFLVIDRAGTADNAYMLSMIDEDDLQEFLEGEGNLAGLSLPQTEDQEQEEILKEEEREKAAEAERRKAETKKNTWIFVIFLAAAGAAFCGGYYYLRIYRPRKEEEDAPDEHLEDAGYGAYEAEDEEPDDDEGAAEAREPERGGRKHGGEGTEEEDEK
ncbi:MAG: DUF4366 domain-containing protein [Lachnospiraceae bacterium]|nr:DUF4366 domain-containing protein [Lachnospiraceae bacterium]